VIPIDNTNDKPLGDEEVEKEVQQYLLRRKNSSIESEDLDIEFSSRGGYLPKLLKYDMFCFLLVLAIFVFALFIRAYRVEGPNWSVYQWKFHADLYWIRVFYGLLNFPFIFFVLPLVSDFLLHLKPTGYNRSGECVPMIKPKRTPAPTTAPPQATRVVAASVAASPRQAPTSIQVI